MILQRVFNERKTKRIAKFDGLEPRRCEDIKGIVPPEIGPKSLGTFEKQASGLWADWYANDVIKTVTSEVNLLDTSMKQKVEWCALIFILITLTS